MSASPEPYSDYYMQFLDTIIEGKEQVIADAKAKPDKYKGQTVGDILGHV